MSEEPDDRRHKFGRRPWVRLDDYVVKKTSDSSERYEVKITGVNLRSAISPPTITVGGQQLRDVRFAPDGRSVTGMVQKIPEVEEVVVDYGFMRAELNRSEERKRESGEEQAEGDG